MDSQATRRLRPRRPIGPASAVLVSCLIVVALAACGQPARSDSTCDGKLSGPRPTYITAWFHDGGTVSAEAETLRGQVNAFNAAQRDVQVRLITLPVGDYARQVTVAATHGDLPDVLDFDGPNLYNYAWSGKLKPIDSCVSTGLREDLLPSILQQGTYAGRLWGIGTFDSGLGLYVRPSILTRAGIRIPTGPGDAWNVDEFTGVLQRLRQAGFSQPLDLQLNEPNPEWYTYGFAPAVWSAGGDLIDRATYRKVDGFLNGPPAVHALTILQQWYSEGYVDPNTSGDAFEEGRSPISWIGHWFYDRYAKAFPGRRAGRPTAELRQRHRDRLRLVAVGHDVERDRRRRRVAVPGVPPELAGGAPDDASERCGSCHEERRPHLPDLQLGRSQAPLHPAAGERRRAAATADPGLSSSQRRVRARVQRGRCSGTSGQGLA